jgi:hypothetical protein
MSTITVIVFICAYEYLFYMNSTSFFYLVGRDSVGDIDLMFLPSTSFMTMRRGGGEDRRVEDAKDTS